MIELIRKSAIAVGIVSVITNSEEKIETQLNSLTRDGDAPIMLISWDINTTLSFDNNGFLDNPVSSITALLVKKPYELTKDLAEENSVLMGKLFEKFIQDLWSRLIPYQNSTAPPLVNVNYVLVPKHGAGKHSGVLCKWDMRTGISIC